jgi:uncharacterized membrane protein
VTVHPFDIRTVLFAKHAQHVVLVHFPIALFITGVAFDFVAKWTKRGGLAEAAYFNLLVGAVSTLPVLVTGLLAWHFHLEGQRIRGLLLLHLTMGGISSVIIWLVWWAHFRGRRRGTALSGYLVPLELLGVTLISLTGHLGGFLSGVNLPG